jgi:hypothetical protein
VLNETCIKWFTKLANINQQITKTQASEYFSGPGKLPFLKLSYHIVWLDMSTNFPHLSLQRCNLCHPLFTIEEVHGYSVAYSTNWCEYYWRCNAYAKAIEPNQWKHQIVTFSWLLSRWLSRQLVYTTDTYQTSKHKLSNGAFVVWTQHWVLLIPDRKRTRYMTSEMFAVL